MSELPPDTPRDTGGSAPPPPPGEGYPAPGSPQGSSNQGQAQPNQGYPSQGYQAAPPPAETSMGPQPGGVLDRFLARLVDFVLLGVVSGIIGAILGAIFGGNGNGFGMYGGGDVNYGLIATSSVISTLLYLGYFTLMESGRGQTVGKMLLKLHTRGPDGGHPTFEQALRRNAWTGLGILALVPIVGSAIGGLLQLVAMIAIAVQIGRDPQRRQAWHDRFAGGTQVVKTG